MFQYVKRTHTLFSMLVVAESSKQFPEFGNAGNLRHKNIHM